MVAPMAEKMGCGGLLPELRGWTLVIASEGLFLGVIGKGTPGEVTSAAPIPGSVIPSDPRVGLGVAAELSPLETATPSCPFRAWPSESPAIPTRLLKTRRRVGASHPLQSQMDTKYTLIPDFIAALEVINRRLAERKRAGGCETPVRVEQRSVHQNRQAGLCSSAQGHALGAGGGDSGSTTRSEVKDVHGSSVIVHYEHPARRVTRLLNSRAGVTIDNAVREAEAPGGASLVRVHENQVHHGHPAAGPAGVVGAVENSVAGAGWRRRRRNHRFRLIDHRRQDWVAGPTIEVAEQGEDGKKPR